MQFSANTFAKHPNGVFNFYACNGQESDCRNNDKGIQNKYGVWYIPNKNYKDDGTPNGYGALPPASFWTLQL